jgi:hypothetical protein
MRWSTPIAVGALDHRVVRELRRLLEQRLGVNDDLALAAEYAGSVSRTRPSTPVLSFAGSNGARRM